MLTLCTYGKEAPSGVGYVMFDGNFWWKVGSPGETSVDICMFQIKISLIHTPQNLPTASNSFQNGGLVSNLETAAARHSGRQWLW